MALIIGSGGPRRSAEVIARDVLDAVGGLGHLAGAGPGPRELAGVAGVGPARATRIAAAVALGRRVVEARGARDRACVDCAADVFARLRATFAGCSEERFVVLALDVRNTVLAQREVARGSLTGVDVHPREVFRPLIREGAAAAIVAHYVPGNIMGLLCPVQICARVL